MSRWREKRVEEDAGQGLLGDDFFHARPMWNAEVLIILQHHRDNLLSQSTSSSSSPTIPPILHDTIDYLIPLNAYPSKDALISARTLAKNYSSYVTDWELAVISNLKIEELEECLSLLPTLKKKIDEGIVEKEKIEELLQELKRYQTGTQ